eukprot:912999-Amorphochlora_amoeboformis.AAC.1
MDMDTWTDGHGHMGTDTWTWTHSPNMETYTLLIDMDTDTQTYCWVCLEARSVANHSVAHSKHTYRHTMHAYLLRDSGELKVQVASMTGKLKDRNTYCLVNGYPSFEHTHDDHPITVEYPIHVQMRN